ncbi:MAG: sensor histidine kinase [Terriglobia bacterium]|jgi:signal transduction histidine kinase|nr:sensor histidine kinase [Terriglobia bacterium]
MWSRNTILSRSSVVLAIGFGSLIVLIAVLGFGAIRRAKAIYNEMETTQAAFLRAEAFRRDIVADMYLSDILVRDYLLDPSPLNAPAHRQQLLDIRASLQSRLDLLAQRNQGTDSQSLDRLQEEVQGYWDSLDPIFEWTAQQKAQRSWIFLRRKVLPRRQAVVALAREMARIDQENLQKERHRIQESQSILRKFLVRMMGFALLLGTLVAFATTYRVTALERAQENQRKRIEKTENDLRRLSRSLVQAQEMERKSLSRELHDQVGQTLTALGIEIGNIASSRDTDPTTFRARIEEAKTLNARAIGTLRDLAMGLRPSMLDDLGLEPALQWQGREFSRHTGVPATVQVDGNLEELRDAQRTCIYRVVQEALTNCARHALAKNVLVSLQSHGDQVVVVVQDDGTGFDVAARMQGGLGLLGMQERVAELDGKLNISSAPRKGTTVRVELPVGVIA